MENIISRAEHLPPRRMGESTNGVNIHGNAIVIIIPVKLKNAPLIKTYPLLMRGPTAVDLNAGSGN